MNIDIAALKQAAQAATKGPWSLGRKIGLGVYAPDESPICMCDSMGELPRGQDKANDAFIAAANPAAVLDLIERLERAQAVAFGGYVIQHADGDRWRTLDSIGMPDWTEDEGEALRFALRKHADAFAADDPEDVRIVLATAPARTEAPTASEHGAALMLAAAVAQSGGRIAISATTLLRAPELTLTRVDRSDLSAGAIEFRTSYAGTPKESA